METEIFRLTLVDIQVRIAEPPPFPSPPQPEVKPIFEFNAETDFNLRFQNFTELLRSFTYSTAFKEKEQANKRLLCLARDFVHVAKTYGTIIISERFLSYDQKTIKPVKLGGFAGGR